MTSEQQSAFRKVWVMGAGWNWHSFGHWLEVSDQSGLGVEALDSFKFTALLVNPAAQLW